MNNSPHGFTFIEILVVVTIIGIISSIGMVTYTEFIKQSRDAKRKGDLEMIRGAIEMYKSKNDAYPTSAPPNIAPHGLLFGTGDLCDSAGCVSGTYLKKLPNDPKTSYNYYYSSSDGSDYTLGAYLEQGNTSDCGANCGETCNYCLGPYGQL